MIIEEQNWSMQSSMIKKCLLGRRINCLGRRGCRKVGSTLWNQPDSWVGAHRRFYGLMVSSKGSSLGWFFESFIIQPVDIFWCFSNEIFKVQITPTLNIKLKITSIKGKKKKRKWENILDLRETLLNLHSPLLKGNFQWKSLSFSCATRTNGQ